MVVIVLVFELHLPAARSLKQKRKIVKSIIERIRQRFRVSVAETDFHDLHQRAEIAIAAVHVSPHQMEQMVQSIRRLVDSFFEAQVVYWQPEYLEAGR